MTSRIKVTVTPMSRPDHILAEGTVDLNQAVGIVQEQRQLGHAYFTGLERTHVLKIALQHCKTIDPVLSRTNRRSELASNLTYTFERHGDPQTFQQLLIAIRQGVFNSRR
ncbi:MAG TPA: hypothetical protein VFZ48_03915 [Candidatus Saccharimonadales bacterium]